MRRGTRLRLADALPRCFPLPRRLELGDQQWMITCSALYGQAAGTVKLRLLLTGPYRRFRYARVSLTEADLLTGRYDVDIAARIIREWLPNSDIDDLLEIDGATLLRVPDLAGPSDDQI